jgi:hypothetical protein
MMREPRGALTRSLRLAPSPASGRGYKRREHLRCVAAGIIPGRVNPRLEKREAPQTARGCGGRVLCAAPAERLKPPQQLRKAPQTAWGFNCIREESPGFLRERRTALSATPHPARYREIYSPLLVTCVHAPHIPPPPHPSAQADIAFSQPRIHSPRLTALSARSEFGHPRLPNRP